LRGLKPRCDDSRRGLSYLTLALLASTTRLTAALLILVAILAAVLLAATVLPAAGTTLIGLPALTWLTLAALSLAGLATLILLVHLSFSPLLQITKLLQDLECSIA
jgi:hypothetical protein